MTRSQLDELDRALERIREAVRQRDDRDDDGVRRVVALAAELDPTPPDDARERE